MSLLFTNPSEKYGHRWRRKPRDVTFDAVKVIVKRWDKKGKLLKILNNSEKARETVLTYINRNEELFIVLWNRLKYGANPGGKLILLVRQIGLGEDIQSGLIKPHLYDWVTEDLGEI